MSWQYVIRRQFTIYAPQQEWANGPLGVA